MRLDALQQIDKSDLEEHAPRILNQFFYGLQEGDSLPTVDNPMVVRQRDIHHWSDLHGAIHHNWSVVDACQRVMS